MPSQLDLPTHGRQNNFTVSTLVRLFLPLILLEIFLGGGGRLFDVGLLSLRMYFFIISLAIGLFCLATFNKFNYHFTLITLFFIALIVIGAVAGLLNHAELGLIFTDVKPLLSFLGIIFFYFAIQDTIAIERIVKLVKFASITLAFAYLTFLGLNSVGLFPFGKFYEAVAPTEEFFFRGNSAFFYKGFFYLGIGFIFFIHGNGLKNRTAIIILISATILTFTRGLIISVVLVTLGYVIFIQRKAIKLILSFFFLLLVGSAVWNFVSNKETIDRKESDNVRLTQIEEVSESFSPGSVLVGHGFGVGTSSKPIHMEIAYLEILHKQGLIGLSFYAMLFMVGVFYFRKASRVGNRKLASPFVLAIAFTFLMSFTNPFLNNPVGINMILLSLVSLKILGHEQG